MKEERLKEIYKNGAIVYGVYREYDDYGYYDNIIEEQDLSERYYIDFYEKYGITGILDDLKNTYDNLFETKAEAEFYAEFGNVEKVIKMPVPPTWEEIVKSNYAESLIDFSITNNENEKYFKIVLLKYMHFNNTEKDWICLICYQFGLAGKDSNHLLELELTEANYYKALDKMVELWREEI